MAVLHRFLLYFLHVFSISIDGTEVLNVTPQQTMWEFGGLDQDGNIDNPWKGASKMAPFDQEVKQIWPLE